MPSIKQVLISLRDPNGVAVRPSGFDCVRPCHSERSGAESNCEAAPSKAKVESRADSAQDDTQGATPSEKITKGVRTIRSYSFSHALPVYVSVLHLFGVLSGGNEPLLNHATMAGFSFTKRDRRDFSPISSFISNQSEPARGG